METTRSRPGDDRRKMPDIARQDLLATVAVRGRAASVDERTLLLTIGSQYSVHRKSTVVYGNTERLPHQDSFDDVSRVMHCCYERSKRASGSVQHLKEFTNTTQ